MTEPQHIVRYQHYVSRFYLRRFANSEGVIEAYNLLDKRMEKAKGPKGICSEYFFYALETGSEDDVSQVVELAFKVLEDYISNNLDEIVTKLLISDKLTDDKKQVLSLLISMLHFRGPQMRNFTQRLYKSMLVNTFGRLVERKGMAEVQREIGELSGITLPEMKDEEKEKLSEQILSLEVNNKPHLELFEDIPIFANFFQAQNWKIYVSRSEAKFITSDQPVVLQDPENWPPAFGVPLLAKSCFFTLTPEILITTNYSLSGENGKTEIEVIESGNEEQVFQFNLKIASGSKKCIFSVRKGELNTVATSLEV
ncbi:DUF4238 domain-containing protein [Leptospira sp. WS58.C1]|uniref:DUF4238 domain-containing protein n=1 Tax=Leptospira cinconiae TaxID=3235173 RepID=UPI00349E51E3